MTQKIDVSIYRFLTLIFLSVALLSGCGKEPEPVVEQPIADQQNIEPTVNQVDKEQAELVSTELLQQGQSILDSLVSTSEQLQQTVKALLTTPNEETLVAAQTQWQDVFTQYQKIIPFLYFDHSSISPSLEQWRFTLAAWPLQPGYLDSYDVYLHSGIVNDITLPITTESLRKQHGLTDTEEVTLGLYAIEFLLWGDKASGDDISKRYLKQTKIPAELAQSDLKIAELPNNRRRELLELQTILLTQDFKLLHTQWQNAGTLFDLYQQISPSEKIDAYHNGFASALDSIENLIAYSIEASNPENTYPERFITLRNKAASMQLAAIKDSYFGDNNSANNETSNLAGLLDIQQRTNVVAKIEDLEKQLSE